MFSSENDENVVNPPQIPTIKNNRRSGEMISLFAAIPAKNPMIKLPAMFTVSVPTGIDRKCTDKFSFETKYLNILPIKPPSPINSNCFIYP